MPDREMPEDILSEIEVTNSGGYVYRFRLRKNLILEQESYRNASWTSRGKGQWLRMMFADLDDPQEYPGIALVTRGAILTVLMSFARTLDEVPPGYSVQEDPSE